jgi:hypothetical protein
VVDHRTLHPTRAKRLGAVPGGPPSLLGAAVPIVAALFLAFVAGGVATLSGSAPGRVLEDAYRAALALHDQLANYAPTRSPSTSGGLPGPPRAA